MIHGIMASEPKFPSPNLPATHPLAGPCMVPLLDSTHAHAALVWARELPPPPAHHTHTQTKKKNEEKNREKGSHWMHG